MVELILFIVKIHFYNSFVHYSNSSFDEKTKLKEETAIYIMYGIVDFSMMRILNSIAEEAFSKLQKSEQPLKFFNQ